MPFFAVTLLIGWMFRQDHNYEDYSHLPRVPSGCISGSASALPVRSPGGKPSDRLCVLRHTWLRAGLMLMRNVPGSLHKRWGWRGRSRREDRDGGCGMQACAQESPCEMMSSGADCLLSSSQCLIHRQDFLALIRPAFNILAKIKKKKNLAGNKEPQWNLGKRFGSGYFSDWRWAESRKVLNFHFRRHGNNCMTKDPKFFPSHSDPTFFDDLTCISTY